MASALAVLVPTAISLWRAHAFERASAAVCQVECSHAVVVAGVRGSLRAAFFVRGEAFVAPAPVQTRTEDSWTFDVPSEVYSECDGADATWGDRLSLVIVVRVMRRETMGIFDFHPAG